MKICFINGAASGSTGNIVRLIADQCQKAGYEVCGLSYSDFHLANFETLSGGSLQQFFYKAVTKIDGRDGFSNGATKKKTIRFLDKQKPALICLNNLHGHYVNCPTVLNWAKVNNVPLVWIVHDDWPLTGRCAMTITCEKWKTGCGHCPFKRRYPKTWLFDGSKKYWKIKHDCFDDPDLNLTMVTVSDWEKGRLQYSYPNKEVLRIYNPLDYELFANCKDSFEEIRKVANGRFVIGYSSDQITKIKGGHHLAELVSLLDPSQYFLVAVGYDKDGLLSKDIMHIEHLNGAKEMAKFYNSIDCLFLPTYCDSFSMVKAEALACGKPVITFNTGGAPELIENGVNGFVLNQGDITGAAKAIKSCKKSVIQSIKCKLTAQKLNKNKMGSLYLSLFERLLQDSEIKHQIFKEM